MNRITFKFTDDTGDFWIAKYCSWQGVSKRPHKNKDEEVGGKFWCREMKVMLQGRSDQSKALAWSSGQVARLRSRAGSHH